MFGYKHYVPVLRWKRAEQIALGNLHAKYRSHITPLIELIPPGFVYRGKRNPPPSLDDLINKTVNTIDKYWGKQSAFLDMKHLLKENNYLDIFCRLNQLTRNLNLLLIPVTGLNRPIEYNQSVATIIKQEQKGVCIRLHINEVQNSTLHNELRQLLTNLESTHDQIDLIVDYESITQSYVSFNNLCKMIPDIKKWRTFTVLSGNFPSDLTGFSPGQHQHPRLDWQIWSREIASSNNLIRKPSYGDYAIQHPVYSELRYIPKTSASIRYTADTYWVIMRGEWLHRPDGPGYSQYPAQAELLCGRSEFRGQGFSVGDQYIYDKRSSVQPEGSGGVESWLRAGFNHHLTFASYQISNLS